MNEFSDHFLPLYVYCSIFWESLILKVIFLFPYLGLSFSTLYQHFQNCRNSEGKMGVPWSNEFEKYSVKQNSIAYFTTGPSRAFSILMCIVTLQKANRDCSVSSSNWSWNPFQRTNTHRTQFINLQIKTSSSLVDFSLVEDMLYAVSLLPLSHFSHVRLRMTP